MPLEGPDEQISLRRAAQLSGLARNSIAGLAVDGRLRIVHAANHRRYTTRRWLHEYLMSRHGTMGNTRPLPEGYQAPDAGEPTM